MRTHIRYGGSECLNNYVVSMKVYAYYLQIRNNAREYKIITFKTFSTAVVFDSNDDYGTC